MINQEDTKSIEEMKNALGDAILSFNEGVRDYLENNLRTEGEEKISNKVRVHLGIYSRLENSPLTKFMGAQSNSFSLAIIYEDEHSTILDANQESLQERQWWKDRIETDNFELKGKEQSINNSIVDGFVGEMGLVLIGEIKDENMLLREKLLLETLLDILSEMLSDTQGIKDIKGLLDGRKKKGYRKLIEAYVVKVFEHYKDLAILKEEDCIKLSHEKYEGREVAAAVYIGGKKEDILGKPQADGDIFYWENDWEEGEEKKEEEKDKIEKDKLEKRKIRYYRKKMEVCKDNTHLITCFNRNGKVNILGVAAKDWLDSNKYTIHIDFSGSGEWYIKENNEEVLCYIKGVYYYSRTGVAQSYKTQLEKEAGLENGMVEKFCKIIKCLSEQEHGAGMIVVENADEIVNNLCIRCNRGTVLTEKLDLTVDKNREFLLGMTSVDGMLLVDKEGKCRAFGVILDGKAWVKANPARGSRYNSAVNYIYDKEGSFAVIVSEDKTVDIVGKSIREKK